MPAGNKVYNSYIQEGVTGAGVLKVLNNLLVFLAIPWILLRCFC